MRYLFTASVLLATIGCNTTSPAGAAAVPMYAGAIESAETVQMRMMLQEQAKRASMIEGHATSSTRTIHEENAQRGRYSAVNAWIQSYLTKQLSLITAANTQTQAEGLAMSAKSVAQGFEDLSVENKRLLDAIDKLVSEIKSSRSQ